MTPQYIEINQHGSKRYYKDKEMTILHREDGPALEWYDGSKFWAINGKYHRLDGPAIEWANGDKSWYINGKKLSKSEVLQRTAPEIVLTMDEIAAKLGIDVSKLKIKK
jgi:FtsP/CotA-like multicopper oxidase with cupredoxin domain